jgi:hypothetical protein
MFVFLLVRACLVVRLLAVVHNSVHNIMLRMRIMPVIRSNEAKITLLYQCLDCYDVTHNPYAQRVRAAAGG